MGGLQAEYLFEILKTPGNPAERFRKDHSSALQSVARDVIETMRRSHVEEYKHEARPACRIKDETKRDISV